MPQRNGYKGGKGRSAIARRVINTNSTNGMMYQGACTDSKGNVIKPCRNFGGPKKGGSAPSATGHMRSRPWRMSLEIAKPVNFVSNIRFLNYNKL